MKTPGRCRCTHVLCRNGCRLNFFPGLIMVAVALAFCCGHPGIAQDLAHDLAIGGSMEAQVVQSSGPEATSYRAELMHRSLLELQLAANRFILAHELVAATDGHPELVLEHAYLSLVLGTTGRLDMGRQEVPLGLGYLFQPVDPLAGTDGRSSMDGLALVLSPWANHGIKAVLALDGLWDGSAVAGDGTDADNGGNQLRGEAWRQLLFGLRYDGLVGAWEPGLAFFFRDDEFLRLAASSRLGLGPAIVRLEGAWDFELPYLYPVGEEASPGDISWLIRGGSEAWSGTWFGDWPGGGGMGLAGIDLYLHPAGATMVLGVEYAYQNRGFDRQERLLAQSYMIYLESPEGPTEPAWESGLYAGQWDTRHRLGLYATVQPTDRLGLSGLLVLGLDYPEGVASSMAELGIELNRPENIDLFLHLRQSWAGSPWDGELQSGTARIGFRIHY